MTFKGQAENQFYVREVSWTKHGSTVKEDRFSMLDVSLEKQLSFI